jgi:oligoribonuclease
MHVPDENNLIWIDLEMTGLDPDRDSIIEIATIVTDKDLFVLAEGPEFAIRHPLERLEAMDDWNRNQHRKSGLWQRVLDSSVDIATAEALTMDFLVQWLPAGKSPMCGNSICQDRRFLYRLMPRLERFSITATSTSRRSRNSHGAGRRMSPGFQQGLRAHRAQRRA